jgi:hypothetical protein
MLARPHGTIGARSIAGGTRLRLARNRTRLLLLGSTRHCGTRRTKGSARACHQRRLLRASLVDAFGQLWVRRNHGPVGLRSSGLARHAALHSGIARRARLRGPRHGGSTRSDSSAHSGQRLICLRPGHGHPGRGSLSGVCRLAGGLTGHGAACLALRRRKRCDRTRRCQNLTGARTHGSAWGDRWLRLGR